ncbi:MAG: transglycosylase domain-containing protein [Chloroflexi bacterium]|nr:transglycosylase domain-containing protein [Chloroflexota bacterium]
MSARSIYLRRRRARHDAHRAGPLVTRLTLGTLAAILGLMLTTVGVGAASAVAIYNYYAKDLPAPGEIAKQTSQNFKTTRIYDRTGTVLLYEILDPLGGDRTVVPLDRMPLNLKNATVAIEDKNFWTNPGFDWYSMGRAAWMTLRREQVQGASTITQQLVKNVLIPPSERYVRDPYSFATYSRKFKEIILSIEISKRYSKNDILAWYLNDNYYGNVAYGVEAAAQAYFGKHVQDLDLAECATLAPIPQNFVLNPIDAPEEAIKRRNLVLDQMYLQGYITLEEAIAAKSTKLRVAPKRFDIRAPHFVFFVRRLIEDKYGTEALYRGGLSIITSLDYNVQQIAEQAAREQVSKLQADKRNVNDASIVVIRPATGEIVAMVGSVDYFNRDIDGQVNVAISPRQPGSTFKVFNYLTAFAQGYTAASVLMDVRTVFDDPPNPPYVPENYDRKYHGPVRLRTALASSFNIPAVKLIQLDGPKNVVNTAHRMGINTLNREKYGLALTLGGGETTLLDMTYANSVLANQGMIAGIPVEAQNVKPGFRVLDPVSILKVTDTSNKTLYEFKEPQKQQIVTPQLAFLMSDILSDNTARTPGFGSNSILKTSRPAAVKTGTTSDWRDNWTVGYTPDYAVGVWVGNADNAEMEHISGVTGAAPIWRDVIDKIHATLPVRPFVEPPGMVRVEVCATSGLLPTPYCPERVKELFIAGTEPKTFDNIWQVFRVHKPTGKLATVYDPPNEVEEKVFPIYPPEAADWVRENKIPQPPSEYSTSNRTPGQGGDVAIIAPASYSGVKGVVPIVGNVRVDNLDVYRLAFGKGLDPTQWTQIGGDHRNRVDNGSLEQWDVTALDGLYTLQLTAVDKSGKPTQATIQVVVDNKPPTIKIINPKNTDIYTPEKDEWVSIGVDAVDNASMGRVEFYLDEMLIGSSTVAPFNKKWTIKMSDTLTRTLGASVAVSPTKPITITRTYQNSEGISVTEQIVGQTARVTTTAPAASVVFTTGMILISTTTPVTNTAGFVESHIVKAIAYDAAGNATPSDPVTIFIQHDVKQKK